MRYTDSVVNFKEMERRMVVARGLRSGGVGSYCLVNIEFQFNNMERILEKDDGDGCTTM